MVGSYKSFLSQDDFWDAYPIDTAGRSAFGWRPQPGLREAALPPSPAADRRHRPRREVACRVDYADSGRFAGVGLITNLSMDGLFMEHVPELRSGDRVTVAFRLPGSPPFKLKGKVKWLDTRGVGLEFDRAAGVAGLPASQDAESLRLYRSWLCRN